MHSIVHNSVQQKGPSWQTARDTEAQPASDHQLQTLLGIGPEIPLAELSADMPSRAAEQQAMQQRQICTEDLLRLLSAPSFSSQPHAMPSRDRGPSVAPVAPTLVRRRPVQRIVQTASNR